MIDILCVGHHADVLCGEHAVDGEADRRILTQIHAAVADAAGIDHGRVAMDGANAFDREVRRLVIEIAQIVHEQLGDGCAASTAVTAIGAFCADSARLRAVTTTVSIISG